MNRQIDIEVTLTSSFVLCSYVKMDVFMPKHERWTFSASQMNNVELARTLSWRENALLEKREKTINSLTYPLVFLLTCPPVNSSTVVIFSVRNLTLWVPFLSTIANPTAKNRFSRRFVLVQKWVSPWIRQNEYLFQRTAICTHFWAIWC